MKYEYEFTKTYTKLDYDCICVKMKFGGWKIDNEKKAGYLIITKWKRPINEQPQNH